ncbi:MAG: hypothetical protein JRE12_18110 [Deltaproteobacteria bacterium]|jgi:hypothetical protein|nr:hypothetical protein [Deltaproteobacteria bacterium]
MNAMINLMKTMMLMPKPWLAWLGLLIAVNILASLYFIQTLEAKIVLTAMMFGMMIMTAIYRTKGFVRLLGIGHIAWLPMLPWLWTRLDDVSFDGLFGYWLSAIIVLNSLSLFVDTIDVLRYIKGERTPYLPL